MNDNDKAKLTAKATAAAAQLTASAVCDGLTVALAWEALRGLVDMPDVKYVRLVHGDDTWTCKRSRLRELRTALRPFRGVLAWLDERGLHLRWHGGRGGLDLRSDTIAACSDPSSFDVTVAGHAPAPAIVPAPEPAPEVATPEPSNDGPGLAFVLPGTGEYTIGFWRAFHRACNNG
jgi:hypothetical protein